MRHTNRYLVKSQTTVLIQLIHCKFELFRLVRKTQKQLVEYAKVVIKGGKRYRADEKLRILKLLNKAVMCSDSNP